MLEDLGMDGKNNVKMDLKELGLVYGLETRGVSCERGNESAISMEGGWGVGKFWPAEDLLASEEGLYCMVLG